MPTGPADKRLAKCNLKTMQMKGSTAIAFDGLEHMTGKSTVTTTAGGKTTGSAVTVDYRWKGAACTEADVNAKKKGGQIAGVRNPASGVWTMWAGRE